MGFNLAEYATVEERLALFWAAHPDGRIHTSILVDDGTRIVMVCEVYRHRDHTTPTSVGHAEEIRTKSGINSMSALEVTETSCVGRALANWCYQAKKRPSRLEMQKPERVQAEQSADVQDSKEWQQAIDDSARNEKCARIKALANANGMTAAEMRTIIATNFGDGRKLADLTLDELTTLIGVL